MPRDVPGEKSLGTRTQSPGAKNTGCVTAMYPIRRSSSIATRSRVFRPRRMRNRSRVERRSPGQKRPMPARRGAAQTARRAGSRRSHRAGSSTRKENSPSPIARNVSGFGRQKLTSSISRRSRRNSNQPGSVGATSRARIGGIVRRCAGGFRSSFAIDRLLLEHADGSLRCTLVRGCVDPGAPGDSRHTHPGRPARPAA